MFARIALDEQPNFAQRPKRSGRGSSDESRFGRRRLAQNPGRKPIASGPVAAYDALHHHRLFQRWTRNRSGFEQL
jgi:hypothetical protein